MTNPDRSPQNCQPVLVTHALQKSYGAKKVLKSVSLSVRLGEFVALLGPNGAGKSTLIQILSGLFVAEQGDLSLLGFDIRKDASKALAGLGVVFQQASLDLDLSVRANLLFHTDLHGLPRSVAQERISAGLEQHGLQAQAEVAVRALSGGNRRKVELIRALLHKPKFLLMDEATVGLDPASRHDLMRSVEALARSGEVAVLWTTHLVDEVVNADRVVVLHQGQIAFDGLPAQLIAQSGEATLEQAFFKICEAASSATARP
ncbi:ATP-binding cassette domain-containing protein [Rhodoferax sp. OV413]|uniref:ATP-binding cassette domain-containing protein n=1 Tax=Rhodoferax sp. OV413 TaxID=1855285 RepID=UPI0025F2D626|nr:ATP-binding cassette domain-containing protein [Rhodoferax sp. OV413]